VTDDAEIEQVKETLIRKRTSWLDKAVRLGIIDYGQRCALLELYCEDVQDAKSYVIVRR